MVSSFYNPFSLFPTSPSQYGYAPIALTGNFTFAWPENNANSQYIIAQIMSVTTSNSGNQFIFPPANLVGTGRSFQIFNAGSLAFTIYDNSVTSLATISVGQLYQCTVTDNTSSEGEWEVLLLGTGSSGANANALSGYGLSSLTNSKINTNLPETVITNAYTVQPSDRGSILSYTGGTNNIILPSPVDGFIVGVINNSTVGGLLTLQPPLGYTINNASNLSLAPGDSTFITGGANYNAIGIGRLNFGTDSLLELDVSASINITLTTAQSSNNIIIFSGNLSNNINVYFTPVQVNKYDIYNNTTGGFNITVSVLGGINTYLLKDQERYAYFTDTSELYNVPSNPGAPSSATFWVSSSNPSLPNQVNLGGLSNGLVGINVAAAYATPYTMPIYNDIISNNFFFGANSVPSPLPTGTNNTAVGINTGSVISTGVQNTAFGSYALNSNTVGSGNTAIGVSSLESNTTGDTNTAFGSYALNSNTVGSDNTAVGVSSLQSNTTGIQNTAIGASSLQLNTTGIQNIAVGASSLQLNTTGIQNIAVGASSLQLNTTGTQNTAVGFNSLSTNSTGAQNTALGTQSLTSNTIGTLNTGIGYQSLQSNTSGGNNTALGSFSLQLNTTGTQNTSLGFNTLSTNTTGIQNTAVGFQSLLSNTTGGSNTAVGFQSLRLNSTGTQNTGIGYDSLQVNTTGGNNTGLGYFTLQANTTGVNNTALGTQSLQVNITGGNNVAVGQSAGDSFDGNNGCTFIGANADSTVGSLTNAAAIGNGAQVSNSNTMILGATGTAVAVNSIANLVVTANSNANGTVGSVQLNGTTDVTVNTTACKTTSRIFLTLLTSVGAVGIISVNTIANGSFRVVSRAAGDNSFVQWFVVNPV
jgi:hypothetical protein